MVDEQAPRGQPALSQVRKQGGHVKYMAERPFAAPEALAASYLECIIRLHRQASKAESTIHLVLEALH